MSIIATEEQDQEEKLFEGIAVCGTNLSTPVVDTSAYINEVHYKVGNRLSQNINGTVTTYAYNTNNNELLSSSAPGTTVTYAYDKNGNLVYLYSFDAEQQHSYVQAANKRDYDVLLMNSPIDTHFIHHLEMKLEKISLKRI